MGCRQPAPQSQLLRYTAVQQQGRTVALADAPGRRRAAGRGAYLHEAPECLERALKSRAFQRALRVRGEIAAELPGDGQRRGRQATPSKAS